ncbi:hypothetical protein MYCTH_2302919 [Thermothelomyces thermophilus ATCC 42464]|uniref:C2 domain-containing protein n=1 Tax=Thermothelomyces thermophilus (strain ATCC 42464 / BCRC 31852 / DSM 1799) TaxID=573729 RepID=G2Q8Q8_THET4|nr:uncharacterized protein MYCTH_2302919 [Thermothelomyces thermophilus ATCC 42464]AEO57107.1 hypothetical protein MYCTH_2302919 [Thermothelomyces thermophilus ATCC 42464]
MTTKAKALALNGMHTAGIFSDMSFDGPEIGTLVLVIDRAKNLPNRKTIGKQDPYCAARLGKEAKKTTTDIRGGQTPRWDQELRFTVHDSPDYYQIKVSVFNDDKKTELIGEAWIDLRDIVVPGGGQSDKWHQLGYKGKYAGEVRIEITYYDSRPKPEKPAAKAKPPPPAEAEANPTAAAAGPRSVPKRRPLPSDPVTGKPPAPPQPAPEQVETPPRPQPNPAPVPHQQAEYNPAPAPVHQHYQQPDQVRELGTPSRRADAPSQQYRTPERHEPYAAQHNQAYNSPHRQQPGPDRRESYDIPQISDPRAADDDRPPPPPAHRSRTGSNPPASNSFQATPPTMHQDVLRSEAHRNSVSGSYPGRPTYKAVDSAPAALPSNQYANVDQGPPARSYSYDPPYEPNRTMQATVEDVPESPESTNRRTSGRWPQPQPQPQSQSQPHLYRDYDMDASPAPLNLSGRGSSESARYPPEPRYQANSNGYPMVAPEIPQRESPDYAPNYGRHSEPSLPLHRSNPEQRLVVTYRGDADEGANDYPVPPVPASLVPGIDPNISQEVSERINQDRRQPNQIRGASQQAMVDTPPRGRSMNDRYGNDPSSTPHSAPPTQNRSPIVYTNGPSTSSVNVVIKSRAYSPNPPRDPSPNPHQQHTIRRKSISPRPPVENERRLSGVPFSPDSYDALNPNASSAALKDAASSRPDYREETGKIISHDGREIDPSDHLPMESWAPEPEPKQPTSTTASAPSRPSLSGPHPVPASGRRPLRIAGRPHSMLPTAGSSSSGVTFSGGITDHVESVTSSQPVASSTGRSRLQKKAAYRQSTSTFTPVMSGANGPGPGPSSAPSVIRKSNSGEALHQDTSFTAPRPGGIPRGSTFDYVIDGAATDNHASPHHGHGTSGVYGTSPGSQRDLHGRRSHSRGHSPARGYERGYDGSGHLHQYSRSAGSINGFSAPASTSAPPPPPIPAKVPLALPPASSSSSSSPPLGSSPGSAGGMSGALQLHSSSAARRAGSGMEDGSGYAGHGYHHQDGYGYGVHGGGGGGGGGWSLSLEEELRQIDIGTGRSSRKHNAAGYGAGGRQGYGTVYGQQGGY